MTTRRISMHLATMILVSLLVSCSAAPTTTSQVDVVASASVVDTAAAFEKAISKDGTWIIATTKDLTIDKDLVLDGDFKNGKKDAEGNELYQRKIGLYTQDADRNITARFSLTAKSLTIKSVKGSLEHGTFHGDLYVSAENFKLVDATVDGNVYFLNETVKSSFTMDETSKITGVQEIKAG